MQLWLPHLRDGVWSGEVGFSAARFASDEDIEVVREATRQMARTVRALHEAGIPLHTGSDANVPNLVPGVSLHRELALLVAAGLDPDDALEASTRRSPRFLGFPNAGKLRPGAPADLALFGEDPTHDIAALDTLLGVVRDGRLYPRADLEARLDRYRRHYEGFAFSKVLMPTLRGALRALTGWLRR
jgi:adenine deaminase